MSETIGRWDDQPRVTREDFMEASAAVHAVQPVRNDLSEPRNWHVSWRNPVDGQTGCGLSDYTEAQARELARQFSATAPHLEIWAANTEGGK